MRRPDTKRAGGEASRTAALSHYVSCPPHATAAAELFVALLVTSTPVPFAATAQVHHPDRRQYGRHPHLPLTARHSGLGRRRDMWARP